MIPSTVGDEGLMVVSEFFDRWRADANARG